MDKWRIAKNSTIVRIAASAGTIVAVAALAGAGLNLDPPVRAWSWRRVRQRNVLLIRENRAYHSNY